MRRATLARAIREALGPVSETIVMLGDGAGDDRAAWADKIMEAIAAIQPVRVNLTQEMADDIVAKIHGPLTISEEFSAFVAEQGKYADCLTTFSLGYGSHAGRGELRMKGDGAMALTLHDHLGATLWRGTFVPPGYRGR